MATPHCSLYLSIKRASHSERSSLENVSIDHGCLDILVSEQILNGTNIYAVLEKVRGEGMAEGVTGHSLFDPGEFDHLS